MVVSLNTISDTLNNNNCILITQQEKGFTEEKSDQWCLADFSASIVSHWVHSYLDSESESSDNSI